MSKPVSGLQIMDNFVAHLLINEKQKFIRNL